MKKTDVYVVVDTPKKANKLKKVLDMFGERTYSESSIQDCLDHTENVLGFDKEENAFMSGYVHQFEESRTEVSIKELRNILAREYLKDGDFVVIKSIYNDDWVMEVDTVEDYKAYHKLAINKSSGFKVNKVFLELNLIRYANEEEKALLEPKKELEVGKWYKGNVDIESLIFITEIENVKHYNRIHGYGFIGGKWDDTGHLFSNTDHEKSLVEASFEDVKQELIKEAKRLGHNYERYSYDTDENVLCGYNGRLEEVFVDGVWNNLQDKLYSLKEAFNNGYCVEFYDVKTDTWKRHENPCWNTDLQWRIMVNNGHLVISDVYLLNQIKDLKKSIDEIKSNIK